MYVSVGSSQNIDPDSNRARIRRFDLRTSAAKLAVANLGGVNFAVGEVFADGLRNEVG